MKPLNPSLFDALKKTFGNVAIANDGEPYQDFVRPNWDTRSRFKQISGPVSAGEYYKVSCFLCNDTRQRLWINHMWGVRHPTTGEDRLYLAHCYNEGCVKSRKEQEQLRDLVYPFGPPRRMPLDTAKAPGSTLVLPPAEPMKLPANLVPLSDPSAATAREYLAKRGFDPLELADRWKVQYSATSDNIKPYFTNRIVIPIFGFKTSFSQKGKQVLFLAGWQARSVNSFPKFKYLTAAGMKKSAVLYGLPQTIKSTGPIVLCEGVTDVWRLGSNAVAILGKSLSHQQRELVGKHFCSRPMVIVLDGDASEDAEKAQDAIRSIREEQEDNAAVVIGKLPSGIKDIGDCTREQAWEAVAAALGKPLDKLGIGSTAAAA